MGRPSRTKVSCAACCLLLPACLAQRRQGQQSLSCRLCGSLCCVLITYATHFYTMAMAGTLPQACMPVQLHWRGICHVFSQGQLVSEPSAGRVLQPELAPACITSPSDSRKYATLARLRRHRQQRRHAGHQQGAAAAWPAWYKGPRGPRRRCQTAARASWLWYRAATEGVDRSQPARASGAGRPGPGDPRTACGTNSVQSTWSPQWTTSQQRRSLDPVVHSTVHSGLQQASERASERAREEQPTAASVRLSQAHTAQAQRCRAACSDTVLTSGATPQHVSATAVQGARRTPVLGRGGRQTALQRRQRGARRGARSPGCRPAASQLAGKGAVQVGQQEVQLGGTAV